MATWGTIFKLGVDPQPNTPEAWAMLAIKAELVYCGIPQGGMQMDNPSFGSGTDRKVKDFQSRNGLIPDGHVGENTAHKLFKKRILQVEHTLGIEPGLLCKTKNLESSDDPACLSDDGNDRGPMQINRISHPQVTDQQCYFPPFCFVWSGKYLRAAYDGVLTSTGQHDWDLALASYNVGWGGARQWDRNGRPRASIASTYVRVVRSRVC